MHVLITVLVGLASTPMLLRWLGAERYGLQRVLESWSQYVGAGSQSVLIAAGVALVPALGRGDSAGVNRLASAAGLTLLLVALLNAAVVLALAPLLPWLAPGPEGLASERLAMWLLSAVPALLVAVPLCRALFEADQRGYRVNLGQTAASLSLTGSALLLAWLGWGLPGQAVAAVVGVTVQSVLLAWWVWRDYPMLRPWPWRADRETLRALWAAALGLLLLAILGTVGSRSEQVCVNYFGGPAAVTQFFLTQRTFALGALQLAALSAATWAPLSGLYHRGEREAFRRGVRDCQRLVVTLAFAGGLPMLAHVRDFLRLWVGEGQYGGDGLALAFTLGLPVVGLQGFQGWLLTATGHARRTLPGVAVYSLTTVLLCAGLGWLLGPPGVAWGVLAATVVLLVANLRAIHRHLVIPYGEQLAPMIAPALLALPVGAAAFVLARAYEPRGWIDLAARTLLIAGADLSLWWMLALPAQERARWRGHLMRLLKRAG